MAPDPDLTHRLLHDPARPLDQAFATLTSIADGAFLYCLRTGAAPLDASQDAGQVRPRLLTERLPHTRWVSIMGHPLGSFDPSDHLAVHRAWLEACHGQQRLARVTVRTIRPLIPDDGGSVGAVGTYEVLLIDLIGTDGIDVVVAALTPIKLSVQDVDVVIPPPQGAPGFRLRLDVEGTVIGGTASISDFLGRSLDDLLGTEVLPLIHPDDLARAAGTWDDVLAHPDRPQTVRIRLLHGDGTWRWFFDTAWNDLIDPDQPGILSEFHDIHAIVGNEQALHASELGFRTLAESLPVGVAVLDEDGRVHFANHRLVTMLTATGLAGPESEAPTPSPSPSGGSYAVAWADLVVPAFAEEVADLLRPGTPGQGAPLSRRVDVRAPDGALVHLLVQVVTIEDVNGRSVIASVQDMSEEVRTSDAHARLIQVVDEIDDAVIVGPIEGTISYVNQAAQRLLGDGAIGRPLRVYLEGAASQLVDEVIEPAMHQVEGWDGDIEIVDGDGTRRTMDATVRPVIDPSKDELHVGITLRDVTAERAHERELAHLARRDPLTDLPNRFSLVETLAACRLSGDPEANVAVLFIDLDNLKVVNDGLGHSAGDRLLVAVADALRLAAGTDTVARFGGDEFVVIADLAGQDALERAHVLLDAIGQVTVPGVASRVSASIGVATSVRASVDGERLLRDADAAMYVAKRSGRARCVLFDQRLRDQTRRRFLLEGELRDSIERGDLTVQYQPIVSVADGRTSGLEALCRWDLGSPADFIPIAEESGLIVPLGRFVLGEALREAAMIRGSAPHLNELNIGVNVSAVELGQPDFAARTLHTLETHAIPTDQVVLELTETILIDPRHEVTAGLHALRDAGVVLALDDFGVGYSSLGYLRRFPLDVLKLDISYTQAMANDTETRVIVEAMTAMAHRLGMFVVAEGVETEEQLRIVEELGIRWVQGWLVGRPAPAADLIASGLPSHRLLSGGN